MTKPPSTVVIFGEPWDAAICEGATVFPDTPTYARCLRCGELFAEGDQGFIRPTPGDVEPEHVVGAGGPPAGRGYWMTGVHRECDLVDVLGHLVGVCPCTGWDVLARATGREVLRRVEAGALKDLAVPALDPEDIQLDIYRTGIDSPIGVRVVHKPTGLVVTREGKGRAQLIAAATDELARRVAEASEGTGS